MTLFVANIGATLLVMQAFSGINVMTSYSTSIFKAAGVRPTVVATPRGVPRGL